MTGRCPAPGASAHDEAAAPVVAGMELQVSAMSGRAAQATATAVELRFLEAPSLILAIESSCDETAASIIDGKAACIPMWLLAKSTSIRASAAWSPKSRAASISRRFAACATNVWQRLHLAGALGMWLARPRCRGGDVCAGPGGRACCGPCVREGRGVGAPTNRSSP